jgi:hypothetical protein
LYPLRVGVQGFRDSSPGEAAGPSSAAFVEAEAAHERGAAPPERRHAGQRSGLGAAMRNVGGLRSALHELHEVDVCILMLPRIER